MIRSVLCGVRSTLVIAALINAALSSSASVADSYLWKVLEAEGESVESIQADVELTISNSEARHQMVRDLRRITRYVAQHQPGVPAGRIHERAAAIAGSTSVRTEYYRFSALPSAGKLRLEHHWDSAWGAPESGDHFGGAHHVRVFDGDLWKTFTAVADAPGGLEAMSVSSEDRTQPVLLTVGGDGVPVEHFFSELGVGEQARARGEITWSELLGLLDPASARDLEQPPPQGGTTQPMLEATSPAWKDTGMGLYRLRVWFDPARSYRISAIETAELQPNSLTGGHEYVTTATLEWSEPVTMSAGELFRRCVYKPRLFLQPPPEGDAPPGVDVFPTKSYELVVHEYEIIDAESGASLSADLFDVTPPPGTAVTDESQGYRYIVGTAGEELQRQALEWARPAPRSDSMPMWRLVLTIACAVVLLAATVYLVARRWRAT